MWNTALVISFTILTPAGMVLTVDHVGRYIREYSTLIDKLRFSPLLSCGMVNGLFYCSGAYNAVAKTGCK